MCKSVGNGNNKILPYHYRFDNTVSVRVDIDSFKCLKYGVPNLLGLFDRYDIKASFYCVMGWEGDIFSIIKHKLFRKIHPRYQSRFLHSREGKSTLNIRQLNSLYGTPEIVRMLLFPKKFTRQKAILEDIVLRGHDLGVHGFVHARWNNLTVPELDTEFNRMITSYEAIFDKRPEGFCSPLALENDEVDFLLSKYGLNYISSLTSNNINFVKLKNHMDLKIVSVPVTIKMTDMYIPPIEYFIRQGYSSNQAAVKTNSMIDEAISIKNLASFFLHPRNEGISFADSLDRVLNHVLIKGYTVKTNQQIAEDYRNSNHEENV